MLERFSLVVGGAALGIFSTIYYRQISLPSQLPEKGPTPLPLLAEPIPFGYPGPVNDQLPRKAYFASYNRRLRHPDWVLEHITKESLKRGEDVDRSKSPFREDLAIPEMFRAKVLDYFKSGFDRGHMAPAADAKTSQDALDETFLLTNIAPQVGNGFNRDYWSFLEEFCRRLVTKENFSDVYVFTGPAYLPRKEDGKFYVKYQLIGDPPIIAVPTHFYKIILAIKDDKNSSNGQLRALGSFLVPNQRIPNSDPLEDYLVPLDAIERTTGLKFFENLEKSTTIPLCKAVKCQLVANPKYVPEELRNSTSEQKAIPKQNEKTS
ncbi:5277_t:CDS:2 [Acaulospora colombiana]|uniref:5277_t:CDS:1 n=1 Tax=Acaulospora colombiana TaxID=27376 RepID=A0ACA9L5F3_9GLOM|nr:5277_t:CDS:2 [Acaulospora colombiana]